MDNRKQINSHDGLEGNEIVLHSRPGDMLNARVYTDSAAGPDVQDDFELVMHYVRLLWKRKWVLVATTTVGLLIAVGMTLRALPIYRASASMEIQNQQEQPFGSKLMAADPLIATQVELLSSDSMRERAISRILGQKVEAPNVAGALVTLRKFLRLKEPATSIPWNQAAYMAGYSASVKNPRDTRILVISSVSTNPNAAAAFADALAEEYIKRIQEERWDSYKNTGEWLNQAQQELKSKLAESDARLQNFAKSKGLIFTGTQNISEDKLKQLQSQLLAASAERITKQSVYESSQNSPSESLPSVLDSGPMGSYQTKLADLRRELAELSTTLTPSHYRTQRVQAQIDELEKERARERANIISRIKIEYDAALKRENELRREYDAQARSLAGQADDIIQYNLLQRETETNKKLYETALQQGKEASLASALRTSNARIVDRAFAPRFPEKPAFALNLSMGMFGGLLCGALFVVVRSRMNAHIQAPGVLELRTNLRELGVIPSVARDTQLSSHFLRAGTGDLRRGRTKLAGAEDSSDCLELVTWNRKPSLIAEAFRATMTSILFLGENGNRPRVFVITSAVPQEGKSTVVSNLAIALAEINHRVLLIDADMRLPRIHSIFDLPNTFGLSDILHEQKPIQDYVIDSIVRKTHIQDLYVLPAGPARMNLSRLLHSTRMKELISRFRETFGTILIDTAPVLNVPDSRILARVSDGVILVVRAHKTHEQAAFAAVKCFAADSHRILGTILNDWNPKLSMYGEYGSYNTYYSQYLNADDR